MTNSANDSESYLVLSIDEMKVVVLVQNVQAGDELAKNVILKLAHILQDQQGTFQVLAIARRQAVAIYLLQKFLYDFYLLVELFIHTSGRRGMPAR